MPLARFGEQFGQRPDRRLGQLAAVARAIRRTPDPKRDLSRAEIRADLMQRHADLRLPDQLARGLDVEPDLPLRDAIEQGLEAPARIRFVAQAEVSAAGDERLALDRRGNMNPVLVED